MADKTKHRQDNDPDDDEEEDDQVDDDQQEDDEDDDDGDATGKKGGKSRRPRTFSEDQVEAIVRQRLRREKRKLTADIRSQVEEDLRSSRNDEDLQKQLDRANEKLERLEELEELAELAEERYEQELETLPDAIRDLAPDDDEPIIVKERWLVQKARPALAKYHADTKDDAKGGDKGGGDRERRGKRRVPKDPPANQRRDKDDDRDDLRKEVRNTGAYRPIL